MVIIKEKLKMEINYTDIVTRMKEAAKLKNDSAVARVLGVTPQALSNYKKRGRMPTNLVIKFASLYGFSVDWLLTGRGSVKAGRERTVGYVGEAVPYVKEAEEELERTLELTPLNPDEIIYIGKLLKILRKANKSTVTAIKCSIDAFLKSVEQPDIHKKIGTEGSVCGKRPEEQSA